VHVVWPDVLQQGSAWHVAVALQCAQSKQTRGATSGSAEGARK
jgi:hypothetical protein